VKETLDGLKIIGAIKTAEILQRANAAWPEQIVPADHVTRQVLHERIEDEADKIWGVCDQDFYGYPDNISALLLEYVKLHKEAF
jgi:hypothetical protein